MHVIHIDSLSVCVCVCTEQQGKGERKVEKWKEREATLTFRLLSRHKKKGKIGEQNPKVSLARENIQRRLPA